MMTRDLYRESLRCETVENFLHFPYVFPLSVSLFFADFVSIRDHRVPRVPNGRRKSGLDEPVCSRVKYSQMVEIGPTGQLGLLKPTRP